MSSMFRLRLVVVLSSILMARSHRSRVVLVIIIIVIGFVDEMYSIPVLDPTYTALEYVRVLYHRPCAVPISLHGRMASAPSRRRIPEGGFEGRFDSDGGGRGGGGGGGVLALTLRI